MFLENDDFLAEYWPCEEDVYEEGPRGDLSPGYSLGSGRRTKLCDLPQNSTKPAPI